MCLSSFVKVIMYLCLRTELQRQQIYTKMCFSLYITILLQTKYLSGIYHQKITTGFNLEFKKNNNYYITFYPRKIKILLNPCSSQHYCLNIKIISQVTTKWKHYWPISLPSSFRSELGSVPEVSPKVKKGLQMCP